MKNIFIVVLTMFLITGCGEENKEASCTNEECLAEIKLDGNIEDVNEIIGLEATNKENVYTYKLDDKNSIIVTIGFEDTIDSVSYEYDKELFVNEDVSFDEILTIIDQVNSNEKISYDDFKNKVGNVEGILVYKSHYEKHYLWVNSAKGFIKVLFDSEDNVLGIDSEF